MKENGLIINCFAAKEITIGPNLKFPFIHKMMRKKHAMKYLKFAFSLKGVKDKKFIENRFSYINTYKNYKTLRWNLMKLN